MAGGIDDETKWADRVFRRGNQKSALLRSVIARAAKRRDDLDKAVVMIRPDSGDHDPVAGMARLEGPAILFAGLTGFEHGSRDRLEFVRPTVLDRLVGAAPFEAGKQFREGDRNDRPLDVFFVPAIGIAKPPIDPGIAIGRKMESAMTGGRMADDPLCKDRGALRGSPGRIRAGVYFAAAESMA